MANPEDLLNRVAAKNLPPQPGAPAPDAAPPQETDQGKAAEKGGPKTEADAMSDNPIAYEVDFGNGDKRKLTPQAIAATFQRYASLNHQNAQMKPVMDVISGYMQANPGMTPQQLATTLTELARTEQHNPTMGGQGQQPQQRPGFSAPTGEDPFAKWEDENAAKLPPGYREMMQGNQQTQAAVAQMAQMMQGLLARTQGVADAGRDMAGQAQQQQVMAIRQAIGNNLDRSQMHLQLPDDAAQDFMTFAGERGYTFEDFVDPQLTLKVMSDFKASMNTPEMDRLRGIAQRRQAFTGSFTPSPQAPAAPAEPQADATFDRLSGQALARRQL